MMSSNGPKHRARQGKRKQGTTLQWLWILGIVGELLTPLGGQATPSCAQMIDAHLEEPSLAGAHWGIVIQDLQLGQTLYQKNAHQLFVPASTLKLFTTAAALQILGPHYRWRTPLYRQGQGNTLEQLTLFAQGDPTLTTAHLTAIAAQLKAQGVRRILKLTLANSNIEQNTYPDSWEWGDLPYAYAPNLRGAILNGNQVTLTLTPQKLGEPLTLSWSDSRAFPVAQLQNQTLTVVGNPQPLSLKPLWGTNQWILRGTLPPNSPSATLELSLPDPHQYFLQVWQAELRAQGIEVDRAQVTPHGSPPPSTPWVTLTSDPLEQVIARINQDSHNLYAEALGHLLQRLAPAEYGGNWLPDLPVKLVDSSGLSRQNLLSPQFLVQLLAHMARTPQAAIYQQSLAIAAQQGTLKNRFRDTVVAGQFRGKTGTLTGTASLAGYLQVSPQNIRIVAILVNNSSLEHQPLRQAVDDILLLAHQCQ